MKKILFFPGLVAFLAVAGICRGADQPDALPVVAPKVKSVAVFKNGLAFVFKTADASLKDGWVRMDELPPATLGSLWIGTTSSTNPVTDVIAYKEKTTTDADSLNLAELLAANAGRQVSITYLSGANPRTVEGTLLPAATRRKLDENKILETRQQGYQYGWQPPTVTTPEMVLLRSTRTGSSERVVLALNLSSIQSVEIIGDANLHTGLEREMARTKIHVGGNPSHAEVTVAGLEKGMVWSPSYRVNIADDKDATVDLDAILADDQEDLEDSDVSFVVGYPNFMFANVLSPISLQQSVASFVQALMSGGVNSPGAFGNIMAQSIAYNSAPVGVPNAGYSVQAAPGEKNEDLYLYHKTGVSLKKGDRARFSLLSVKAPYEHVYQWEVADSMNIDDRGIRTDHPKDDEKVWHVIRLRNTGTQPWTTAPAFTMNNDLPVAQDTLSYTPPGGQSTLKLTVSSDVHGEQNQTETARRQTQIANRNYDEVTVSGKLNLANWKDKEIAMVVHKSLVGEVLESPDGTATKVARNLAAVNPTSEIQWEFKLPAGQTRELAYQYKVLLIR